MKEKKSGEQLAQLLKKHTLTLLPIGKVDQCSGKPLGLKRRNRFYKTSLLFYFPSSFQSGNPSDHPCYSCVDIIRGL